MMSILRLALCKSIYVAGLKLVCIDGAKLLTDENGNVLDDSDDLDVVVDTLDSHVLAFLSQTDGNHLCISSSKLFISQII